MQIKWEKKAKGIYIGIGVIELKNTMPRKVALRLDGRGKLWRVDLTTGSSSPWQAIDGGVGVRTLTEAKNLAQAWLSSAGGQGTLTPRGAYRNPPVCYIPPIPPVPARRTARRNPPESRVMSIPRPRVYSWDSERAAMLPPPPARMAPDLPIPSLKLPPLDPGLSIVRKQSRREASLTTTRKSGIKARSSSRPSSVFTANDLAPVSESFVKLRGTAAKKFKDVGMTRLEANASIHDSPRAFAITEIRKDGPVITVAPELAKQPKETIDGVIAHELGHVAVMLGHFPMKSAHDDMQRQADSVAESIFGKKIYYKGKLKVQAMGKGVKGLRPRPASLR